MKENKISSLEFCSAYILISIVSILGVGFYSALRVSHEDVYLSAILAFIINTILLFIFFIIFNYEPNLSIYNKTKKICGKFFGTIINLIFILICIDLLISGTYNFLTFINSQMLPETSIIFLGIASTIVAVYLASKKVNTIFRISPLLAVINSIAFIIAAFNLTLTFDKSNLLPFLSRGIMPVIKGAFFISFQTLIPLFCLLVIPKNKIDNSKKINKKLFLSSIFVYILIFLLIVLTIGNLGIDLSRYYAYPEYMVLKNIEMFGFIDRIENILTLQWIFGFLYAFAFLLYYFKEFTSNSFKLNLKHNLEISFIGLFSIILGDIIFKNDIVYAEYIYKWSPYLKTFLMGLLFLLSIILLFKKKKK